MEPHTVWVFMGEGATFPSGIFSAQDKAEAWIAQHALSGVLTHYSVDEGVYDWAIRNEYFRPRPEKRVDSRFISRFTSGRMTHVHYEDGRAAGAH